jgi:hypothetical protein
MPHDISYATNSDRHRGSSSTGWASMAMALPPRSRTPAGRHSHRNRERHFLLSDHDLRSHLHRPVDCHLGYPPLVRLPDQLAQHATKAESLRSPAHKPHRVEGAFRLRRAKEDIDRSSDDAHTVCPISLSTLDSSRKVQEHVHITVAMAPS